MAISMDDIKKLREATGARIMDCKKALEEADGDFEKAIKIVEEKGLARAEKTADRETKAGYVASYIHSNGQVGSLVEMVCETDFVAQNDEFRTLAREIALHIAAMNPGSVEELLDQEYVRDASTTIAMMVKSLSGKIGEKMQVRRFTRYSINDVLGE